jgi:hypothetical protein
MNYEPGSLEAAPTLSLFAMDGWACSRVRFNLRKDRHVWKGRRAGRQKPQHQKELTPREEQLASQRPDRWASGHLAPRLQAPLGQALALAQRHPLDERRG